MSVSVMSKATRKEGVVAPAPPDPEVPERPTRRKFTAEYKLAILKEVDLCTVPGEIGAILRREGLYSSHLVDWRRQRDAGALKALGRPRGRKRQDPLFHEVTKLRQENERLTGRLHQAERIIDIQGKLSELLGVPLSPASDDDGSGN